MTTVSRRVPMPRKTGAPGYTLLSTHMKNDWIKQACLAMGIAACAIVLHAQQMIPNSGQKITPLAPTGAAFVPLNPGLADNPQYLAGQAVTSIVSPDGKTLL